MKKNKSSNKGLTIVLLILIICGLFTAVTFAYLSATTSEVSNTFVAADGLIDTTSGTLENNFNLKESEASLNNGVYVLNTDSKVTTNSYTSVVPGMSIAKDPTLIANISSGVNAYIYIEVVDSTQGNLTYTLTDNWLLLSGVTGANGGSVYLYRSDTASTSLTQSVVGDSSVELSSVPVFTENKVVAKSSSAFIDVDPATAGTQLGQINLYAYAAQSSGFTDAAAAYDECF